MKKIKFIILVVFLLFSNKIFAQIKNENKDIDISKCHSYLTVDVDDDIFLGKVPKGVFKIYNNKFMKFSIHGYGCSRVRVTCYSEKVKDGVTLSLTWKMGPCSGMEYDYKNTNIYLNWCGYYYIKMQLNSADISNSARTGSKVFTQKICVEYNDI